MRIDYEAKKFVRYIYGKKLVGKRTLEFSESELIYSAIMVGKANYFDYWNLGISAEFEIKYRILFLATLIFVDQDERLIRTSSYSDGFDPTEKGFASYYIGNVISKLVATKLLNIVVFAHYDLIKKHVDEDTIKALGDRKPDFIGLDCNNNLIIAESKGRTHGFDKEAVVSGKNQAARIYSVNGVKPSLKYVLETYFKNEKLFFYIEDPDENDGMKLDIPINLKLIKKNYYKLLIDFLYKSKKKDKFEIENNEYICGYIEELNTKVGLNVKILEEYLENFESFFVEAMSKQKKMKLENIDYFIGADQVIVICEKGVIRRQPML